MARTQVATDAFGSDSGWTEQNSGFNSFSVSAGVIAPTSSGITLTDMAQRMRSSGTYADDQYSKIAVSNYASATGRFGVSVRAQGTGASRSSYAAYVRGFNKEVVLAKVVSGTVTTLTGPTAVSSFVDGDTIELECVGANPTKLTVYRNGSALSGFVDIEDSAIDSGGRPGIVGGTSSALNGDNWEGGTLEVAAPVLSAGTISSVTSTGATIGATTTIGSGTAYFLKRTSLTPASVATVKSTGESQAVSGTSISRAMTGWTTGATYYVDVAQNDGTSDTASVLSVGPIYPGTFRAVSDLSVSGWTVTGAATHAAAINEDSASDSEYSTSPILSGTPVSKTHGLPAAQTMAAGSYTVQLRAKVASGTGYAKLTFLTSGDVEVGNTGNIGLTDAYSTYSATVTIAGGTATKWREDYWV